MFESADFYKNPFSPFLVQGLKGSGRLEPAALSADGKVPKIGDSPPKKGWQGLGYG